MSEERMESQGLVPRDPVVRDRRVAPNAATYGEGYPDDSSGDYGYASEGNDGDAKVVLRKLLTALKRRKWLIIAATLLVTGAVAIEVYRVRPTYTASTIVEVRSQPGTVNGGFDAENSVSVNTKVLMFSSRPLLEDVVLKLGLNENARFLDVAVKRTRWNTLMDLLRGRYSNDPGPPIPLKPSETAAQTLAQQAQRKEPKSPGEPDDVPVENPKLDRFVAILEGGMRVEPVRETKALRISFMHADRYVAKSVADGLAQSFIRQNYKQKTSRFERNSNWLERSTHDLKNKVKDAEQRLTDYSRENDFLVQGQPSVTTDRLVRLRDQAVRAEVELLLKKTLYDEVVNGRGSQLPDAFTDPRIAGLQSRLNELQVSLAQLGVSYGPEHPRIVEVQQQAVKLQEQLDVGVNTLKEKIKNDYSRAYRESQSLTAALNLAKVEAANQDQAAIQYNILKQDVDTARSMYNEFLGKTNQSNLEAAQQESNVTMIRPARMPGAPDGPSQGLSIITAFVFTFVATLGIAFAIEFLDTTVKNAGDVARYGLLPTLGVIPAITKKKTSRQLKNGRNGESKLLAADVNGSSNDDSGSRSGKQSFRFLRYAGGSRGATNGMSDGPTEQIVTFGERTAVAEAYRVLRTSVLFSTSGGAPKTILITSAQPGEGKTTTAINTAVSLAHLGASVLIIDADLRKPTTHKGFGVQSKQGLSSCLANGGDIDQAIQSVRIRNLSLLPCGPIPVNPSELLSSEKMKELLRVLGERFDHILIDSPPLMHVTDPVILSTLVDGVILVVHGGKSSRDVMRQSRQLLTSVGATVLGVVLNNVRLQDQPYVDFPYQPYASDKAREKDEGRVSDIFNS